jgi:hypothetical protein
VKLVLDLREKTGREGVYLFAALPAFNVVVFVHPNGERDGIRQYQLVVKPYTGTPRSGEAADDCAAWRTSEGSGGPSKDSEGTPPRTDRP